MKLPMPVAPDIIGRLLDRHAAPLMLYARQFCNDPDDAVQQAFMKLAAQKQLPNHPAAWLFKVVRNEALMASRANDRRKRREKEIAHSNGKMFQTSIDEKIDAQFAAESIESLPGPQREIVIAHIWGGLTFREIAELTGSSASSAHRNYQTALESLRTSMGVPCQKNN